LGFSFALVAAALLGVDDAYARGGGGHGGGHHGGGHHGGGHHGGGHSHSHSHHHSGHHDHHHSGHHDHHHSFSHHHYGHHGWGGWGGWNGTGWANGWGHNWNHYPYGWGALGLAGFAGYGLGSYTAPAYVYPEGTPIYNDGTSDTTATVGTIDDGSTGSYASNDSGNDDTAATDNGDRRFSTPPGQQNADAPSQEKIDQASELSDKAETEFKEGRYQKAAEDWRQSLLNNPADGAAVMLLSQSLFATGKYDEAAGAAQVGMHMLPLSAWGSVIANYRELYGNNEDYTTQLGALESAVKAQPNSPALRFLLGYHLGFQGQTRQAIKELDKTLELAPKDEVAQKLREVFAERLTDGSNADAAPGTRQSLDINIREPNN